MYKSIIISATLFSMVLAGGDQVCLQRRPDDLCIDYQSTKDCCAAVGGSQTYFREQDHVCSPNFIGGNSVNTGKMVDCCESRGMGSRGTEAGDGYLGVLKCHELDD